MYLNHRRPLPLRRRADTFEIEFGSLRHPHVVTVGYYADNATPGEVFISGGRSGESVEAIARDGAILFSLCLQNEVPLQVIQHAVTRDSHDRPLSIIGHVVDRLLQDS